MKCTVGKNGQRYYFLNGKRIKNPRQMEEISPEKITFLVFDEKTFSSVGSSNRVLRYEVPKGTVLEKQREIVQQEEKKFKDFCVKFGDDSLVLYTQFSKGNFNVTKYKFRIIAKSNTRTVGILCLGDKSVDCSKREWF